MITKTSVTEYYLINLNSSISKQNHYLELKLQTLCNFIIVSHKTTYITLPMKQKAPVNISQHLKILCKLNTEL